MCNYYRLQESNVAAAACFCRRVMFCIASSASSAYETMHAPRCRSCTGRFHPSTNRRISTFESNGERDEPWGLPRFSSQFRIEHTST